MLKVFRSQLDNVINKAILIFIQIVWLVNFNENCNFFSLSRYHLVKLQCVLLLVGRFVESNMKHLDKTQHYVVLLVSNTVL